MLGLEADTELLKAIVAMLFGLTTDDFAHVEAMGTPGKNQIYGDVYGRLDQLGLWFIKIQYQETDDGTTTVVMSCHATDQLTLKNGIVLRKPTS